MKTGKSNNYKWRIVKVKCEHDKGILETFALQRKMYWDFFMGWSDMRWGPEDLLEQEMEKQIAYDNRIRTKTTYIK